MIRNFRDIMIKLRGVKMIRIKYVLPILLLAFTLFSGCSLSPKGPQEADEKSNYTNIDSTSNNIQSKNSIDDLQLRYIDYSFKKVFIEKEIDLLGLPESAGPIINKISKNTVVKVIKAANVKDSIWLYIEIPVLDSPVDFRGWIREADTIKYTKEQIKLVQSPVTIKSGESVYEVDDFNKIQSSKPLAANENDWGRIEEKRDGYVSLDCPGGRTVWVKESSLVYPEAE